MRNVIERILQSMPAGDGEEIDEIKKNILAAAEQSPEAVLDYFENVAVRLTEEAEALSDGIESTMGGE